MKNLYFLLLMFSTQIGATEGGNSNYTPGFYGDFAMAAAMEKGLYFNNFMAAYQDNTGKTGTVMDLPSFELVTDYKILGGTYVAGIYPGAAFTKDSTGTKNQSRLGGEDVYLMPLYINWQWQDFSASVFEGVIAPSGYYKTGALNTGLNIWTFDHNLALTLKLPAENELSVNLGYMNNLKNYATGYHNGDEFHLDYTLGHYLTPKLGLGITGSFYRQVSPDHAPISILATTPTGASSIGPVLMFAPHLFNREVTLSLKWLHEFDVQARPAQDYLIFRAVWCFE